jgi:hypothetical protein
LGDEAAQNGVVMYVIEFLMDIAGRSEVAVVAASALPESVRYLPAGLAVGHAREEGRAVLMYPTKDAPRKGLLNSRQYGANQGALVRQDDQVNVLWHDDESPEVETDVRAGTIQELQEPCGRLAPAKEGLAVET